jgi:hypothetical protein
MPESGSDDDVERVFILRVMGFSVSSSLLVWRVKFPLRLASRHLHGWEFMEGRENSGI